MLVKTVENIGKNICTRLVNLNLKQNNNLSCIIIWSIFDKPARQDWELILKQFTVKSHNWISSNCDFNLYLVLTMLINKFKTTGYLQGNLSLSSCQYWSNKYQELRSNLSPCSGSVQPWSSCTPSTNRGHKVLYISCFGKLHRLCVLFHGGRL